MGEFWILAAIFRFAGVTLRYSHLLISLDIGVIIGLTYWLAVGLTRRYIALACTVLCLAIFLSSPTTALDNHRWDANAFALASVAAVLYAVQSSSWIAAIFAGIFGVCAAWVTPPDGLIVLPAILRIWLDGKTRRLALPHLVGLALAAFIPAVVLNAQGALGSMLNGLLWNPSHYYGANRVPYGFIFGGPGALFAGAQGFQLVQRAILAMPFLLPATLPPIAALAWLPAFRTPRRPEIFLLLAGAAVIAANYPRCDLAHLVCELPIFVILGAVWLERHASESLCVAVLLVLLLPAIVMCRENLTGGNVTRIGTPVGQVGVASAALPLVRMSLSHVHPGDSLFVFPYEPMFYFLTRGRNASRYFWLQPGMMGDDDESAALADLTAHPPQWIIYRNVEPEAYLRIWPGSDRRKLRMPRIEEFIHSRYRLVDSAWIADGERQLLERIDPFSRS